MMRYAGRAIAIALGSAGWPLMSMPARAADVPNFAPQLSGPQFMVYLSRPIGAGVNTYGLRYERASPWSADPGARFCAPLRHRSLIDLQLTRGYTPRMQFGNRVTRDIGRRQLEPTSLATAVWPMVNRPLTGTSLAAWVP